MFLLRFWVALNMHHSMLCRRAVHLWHSSKVNGIWWRINRHFGVHSQNCAINFNIAVRLMHRMENACTGIVKHNDVINKLICMKLMVHLKLHKRTCDAQFEWCDRNGVQMPSLSLNASQNYDALAFKRKCTNQKLNPKLFCLISQ